MTTSSGRQSSIGVEDTDEGILADLTLKIFSDLYCHMLVLNNLKMLPISQIFLHKLGSNLCLVHTDAVNAVEGCTSFWHLLLANINSYFCLLPCLLPF